MDRETGSWVWVGLALTAAWLLYRVEQKTGLLHTVVQKVGSLHTDRQGGRIMKGMVSRGSSGEKH